jgi:predicted phosphohydrolase
MRLAWITDVHLDFLSGDQVRAFCGRIARRGPDALAISGDIADARSVEHTLRVVADDLGVPIYFVLGNHDFYYGSIEGVRRQMAALTRTDPRIQWLPERGVVSLGQQHAIVGHDGWADGRHGDPLGSHVFFNDWLLIAELSGLEPSVRLERLHALGDEAATALRAPLWEALGRFANVFVMTHVPPFPEVCRYWGRICSDAWLPWLTCRAVGDLLLDAADRHADRRITVLCGHSHGAATARLRPNLIAHAGRARYGHPKLARMFTL